MKRMRNRRRGGWVLVAVLVVLALLSALAASFFVQATETGGLSKVNLGHTVAMSHSDYGLQDALRALRSSQIDVSGILTECTGQQVESGGCVGAVSYPSLGGPLNNGNTLTLDEGGGLQYQYFIYRAPGTSVGDNGVPSNRYVIRSVGYYGYNTTSANLITSVAEMEVDIGGNTKYHCVGGYECQ